LRQQVNINPGQSTHTSSVIASTFKAAQILKSKYGGAIVDLPRVLKELSRCIAARPDTPIENAAAKRAISRLTDIKQTYSKDGISVKELLALIFVAIKDPSYCQVSVDEAINRLIMGLHEIQRGNNKDDTDRDLHICYTGTFNKLVEVMQSVLPACTVNYITSETASLKLPIVVQEEVLAHLRSCCDPTTLVGAMMFAVLMNQINCEGIHVIWADISKTISDRMFDEFGEAFGNRRNSAEFQSVIETGMYTNLGELDSFKESFSESAGYRAYVLNNLRLSAALARAGSMASIVGPLHGRSAISASTAAFATTGKIEAIAGPFQMRSGIEVQFNLE
jgi:hypothetical protein